MNQINLLQNKILIKNSNNNTRLSKDWIVGFTDGEGCFYIGINLNNSIKLKEQVLPEFKIIQHKRNIKLLYKIKKFFNCGIIKNNKKKDSNIFEYRVRNINHLNNIIIPFFKKNKLLTCKKFDFNDFNKVLFLISQNLHLTPEGLIKIKNIKNKMNTKRIIG